MTLFNHKTKNNKCEIVNVTCPNCHKEHQLRIHDFQWCLDGTPNIPIAQHAEAFAMCECGMVVTVQNLPTAALATPEYQELLKIEDECVRKLMLIYCIRHEESVWSWLARYYHECNNPIKEQEYLQRAIEAIENHCDRRILRIMPDKCASVSFDSEFYCYAQDRLVDFYRRTRRWDDALRIISTLRDQQYLVKPYARLAVLTHQEKLIHKHNDAIQ